MLTVENARGMVVRCPCETAVARAIRSMIGNSATLPTMRRIYRWLWFRRSSFHPANLLTSKRQQQFQCRIFASHVARLIVPISDDELFEK
jgi:hypothetical protein